ncbi:MAG: NAD(P)/FAD-dependent oxidoreductase [Verrucomicrobia bacterium]|nr:NAD(P)/FAD-dependent oxidoreductase [Verrucomicrobiota bacterium]
MTTHTFDVAVIGGGSGGYAAARATAAGGLKTAVIEGGAEVGGLCILRGCMPTKALLYAAEILHQTGRAATWGLRAGHVGFDWTSIQERKARLIEGFASHRREQLASGRFGFFREAARFVSPRAVELANGDRIEARYFVIATGSKVSEPLVPGLSDAGYWTSDDALTLERLPASLVVLGGGAVAVEFAQLFCRLGVRVTLIQRSERILKDFDADAAACVEEVFRREGMTVHTGVELRSAGRCAAGKYVEFSQAGRRFRVEGEAILFALGRSPNTESLNLEAAGVATERGRVIANLRMQTSAPHIFTAGDCTGPRQIVHIAVAQGETAGHNILHPDTPREMDDRLLTSVVFTDPQVAFVGLTEKEAARRGIAFKAASYPFNDHGKSMIMEALDGFVKLLADPRSGEILGGACVGPMAGELIHEVTVAMAARMTAKQLALTPHYHPTLAEIWTYPAEELL